MNLESVWLVDVANLDQTFTSDPILFKDLVATLGEDGQLLDVLGDISKELLVLDLLHVHTYT